MSEQGPRPEKETVWSVRLRRLAGLLALCWALLIVILSLSPAGAGASFPGADKVMHFLAYGGLAFLWGASAPHRPRPIILGLVIAYGFAMELAQGAFTSLRTPSLLDAAANGFGAIAVLLALSGLTRLARAGFWSH